MNFIDRSLNTIDAWQIYQDILCLPLHFSEPRFGCSPRAQTILDWLLAKTIAARCPFDEPMIDKARSWKLLHEDVGRVWALPMDGHKHFPAPLYAQSGKPLAYAELEVTSKERAIIRIVSDETQCVRWGHHVAATARTTTGEWCVFDPVLFDGPVNVETWTSIFNAPNVEFIQTNWGVGPRFGWFGSPYSPEQQQDHEPSYSWRAQSDMQDLIRVSPKEPIAYIKHKAPKTEFHIPIR